ncbi:GRF1-interacting factor 2-like [Quillaja saponaria]|uniref:GRF1-interacting factor 2-like n=1 Tax=Quillaja saponaria TaxID=32244 RepID=A0AAD7LVT4_QUISA|nr:GRF1-interacting factor 2-like [Quillaja saponaria]
MFNGETSFPTDTNLTTEQIQEYLEENKQLIITIMKNQNLEKFSEVALHQALLQQNLTYLAKVADAQTREQTMHPQSTVQQGNGMHHPPLAMSKKQSDSSASQLFFQLNDQQQQQHQPYFLQQQQNQPVFLQQQQLIQGEMSKIPGGTSSIYQAIQTGYGSNFSDTQGSKQGLDAAAGYFLGKSVFGHNGGDSIP